MAKKKKKTTKKTSSKKKQSKKDVDTQSFWPIAGAIAMLVIAFFILLGSFDSGGPLPVSMFEGVAWALGYGAYITPFALACFGVWKMKSETQKIPLQEFVSVSGFLVVFSAWLYVTFSASTATPTTADAGGAIGELFGTITLQALNRAPASVLFFVLSFLLLLLSFRISPKTVYGAIARFAQRFAKEKDTDIASLKEKAQSSGFKLKEGVPVEYGSSTDEDASKKRSTLKNTAKQLSTSENHEALTVASDPDWKFPGFDLLNQKQDKADAGDVNGKAEMIKSTLANFNIEVEMEGANIGPRVTQYTLKPPTGVKLTKLTALENNLALDLAATAIRMEAPIPGKRLVGIEVPNEKSSTVRVSSILQSKPWKNQPGNLTFAVGKDISGDPIALDLAKMPHLLVAGQTGSGKSVMINTILTSLVYRNSPSDLKLILVDPKFVELKTYNDIPHLLTPVITEPEKCISALKWAVAEMERRLRTMSESNASNIDEYNTIKQESGMPYIVIVIDELSDLMMMAARDVESLIVRLAQKSRAAGIHLVLATQRPSVNVITGLIKANIPARIAFTVNSHVDSKTILDQGGAEKLLGMGDMLYTTSEMPKPTRAQGALINKDEIIKVTDFLREQRQADYDDEVVSQQVQLNGKGGIVADYGANDADDDMYKDAVHAVVNAGKASTSMLQRKLRIGYGRAARLVETMEEQGIVGPADGSRPREVLVSSVEDVFNAAAKPSPDEDDVYEDMEDEA
jgi:S-DNA-T family DNA segregation ATPase FtsK/SpoIIIE